ncbi:MAG TPA: histidine kinase, partial [Paracoccus sp. (in: a-proteobacteria)]|nr:histidine kinase [Paracoccus sp. (in: a-proteobacteria)]
ARLSGVLGRLAHGNLTARAGPVAVPDLAPLAADVDRLAAALTAAQADRARLSRQVVERGDQERKAIARDLHDEYGPCLFALRVEAAAIRDAAADVRLRGHAENILAIADEIRRVNTALLSGLRPMAVGQLPLAAVLRDLFDDLAARHEGIDWSLEIAPDLPEPDEAAALTLYRILQEGTTNILRHSGARRAAARVGTGPQGWTVSLSDDGAGLGDAVEGNGLSGMRERVALLGGTFAVQSGTWGVTLSATLPMSEAA